MNDKIKFNMSNFLLSISEFFHSSVSIYLVNHLPYASALPHYLYHYIIAICYISLLSVFDHNQLSGYLSLSLIIIGLSMHQTLPIRQHRFTLQRVWSIDQAMGKVKFLALYLLVVLGTYLERPLMMGLAFDHTRDPKIIIALI